MADDKNYTLTDSQLITGIEYCLDKVTNLLDNVESLVDNQEHFWESSNALGLYTFAVEEYGKALLLRDYYQKGMQNIQVPQWIFARGKDKKRRKSHDIKIQKAFDKLPNDCKNTMVGIVIDKPLPNATTLRFKDGGSMSIGGQTTGLHMTNNDIDFEVRMKCFYVDWDKLDNKWEYELTTHKDYLKTAIIEFRKHLTEIRSTLINK